jgi:hypothetical protein
MDKVLGLGNFEIEQGVLGWGPLLRSWELGTEV